ncbi:unnamed protein product [Rotaria socialis]|uniref:FLYWCH-type domain-containing protein n=1 Tax=Rotaria socialis TaxID=392032 RepID=A0A819BNL2_9BILA|nr:unnamed protein product [Rotaria socialis]
MSTVKSSKNRDQLLFDGFRYRCDKKSQAIWWCCKNNCGGPLGTTNTSIYEPINDLQMEQHASLIMAEQLQAGLVKKVNRIKYELLDEQLQQLVPSFDLIAREVFFKRARALFYF